MKNVSRKIDKLGRIVLPMDFRRALGLEGEARVFLNISGSTITIRSASGTCKLCGSLRMATNGFELCEECYQMIRKAEP